MQEAALHVMPNLDSSILDQALAPFKSVKILSIRNAANIFDHFIDPQVIPNVIHRHAMCNVLLGDAVGRYLLHVLSLFAHLCPISADHRQ